MKVYYGFKKFKKPAKGLVAAIGIFDGLHVGHRRIMNYLVKMAKALNKKSLVITFEPHPLKILRHKAYPPSLISFKHRLDLLRDFGVDAVMVLRFDEKLAKMKGKEFINDILIGKIGVAEIAAGSGFHLGSDRLSLERIRLPFKTKIIPSLKKDGSIVSSTRIRNLIMKGDLKHASKLLASPVSVLGRVVRGARRGRKLGFPTANIDPHHEAIPPAGVYAVRVVVAGERKNKRSYKGILNIGFRPTFHGKPKAGEEPVIEVYIMGLKKKHIYGKAIEVEFVKRIRRERHFKHPGALRRQIEEDVVIARRLLK